MREKAFEVINNFKPHLNETCIGSISELFEPESAHQARGCVASACSVGELLRVIKDHYLYEIKMVKTGTKAEVAQL
jgi:glycogen debranching enzyme